MREFGVMNLSEKLSSLHDHLTNNVLGSDRAATLLLVALLAKGHALIEGPPGIGKTSIAQALAGGVSGSFKRVQFTPDLLPSDILGYNLYRQHSGDFEFVEGPVFANLLLADEINRTSPRVQSALLEAMNEGQVTIDGKTRQLEAPFMVVATQNELSSVGTFPLPEAQLDRFLVSIQMETPSSEVQQSILMASVNGSRSDRSNSEVALSVEEVIQLQKEVQGVGVSEALASYIIELCERVRREAGGAHTVSVRASLAVLQAAQARALIDGESHVLPDHVKDVFVDVMRHRLLPEDANDAGMIVSRVLSQVEIR